MDKDKHKYGGPSNSTSSFSLINSLKSSIQTSYFQSVPFPDNSYNNYIYVANDGGIYKSTSDGANWKRLTGNIAANEFYDIGVTEANSEMIIGGTQDGGTYMRVGSGNGDLVSGGDGNNSLIDQADTNYFYCTATRSVYRRRLPKDSAAVYIQTFDKIGFTIGMDPQNSSYIYKVDMSPIDNKLHLRKTSNRGASWSDLDQIYKGMSDMEFGYEIPNSFYIITYDPWWKANSELYSLH